ncbi:light-regulated zinc finger protein 1 [Perilla frutescens var. frutescens]|nr:light-regulated zinc finger protein 1 [Perilla frutescens var. frutescens]
MKIQCNVCEAAEAKVLCCADEAALCGDCDQKVHAANKLASKHQRVPLSTSSLHMPKCDICQETVGYFFCLEDRSLLCRRCDVAVHTVNPLVSAHQRFLLTGVKVGLEATAPGPSSPSGKTRTAGPDSPPAPKRTTQASTTDQSSKSLPIQASVGGDFSSSKLPFTGGSTTGSMSQWQLEEFLELGDYNQNYDFMDRISSKADCEKFGDPDCSPILRVADAELEGDECMGQAPDTFWAVPEIPSPPTASGLYWPKAPQILCDSTVFVPDIISSHMQNFHHHHSHGDSSKRRKRF